MIMHLIPPKAKYLLIGLVLLISVLVIGGGALFVMKRDMFFDTFSRRRAVAAELTELAKQVREHPDNKKPLLALGKAAESGHQFDRCYALATLGGLRGLAR